MWICWEVGQSTSCKVRQMTFLVSFFECKAQCRIICLNICDTDARAWWTWLLCSRIMLSQLVAGFSKTNWWSGRAHGVFWRFFDYLHSLVVVNSTWIWRFWGCKGSPFCTKMHHWTTHFRWKPTIDLIAVLLRIGNLFGEKSLGVCVCVCVTRL